MRQPFEKIELLVEGEPRPQPRPTADGRGKFIRVVSAKAGSPVIGFKESLNLAARKKMAEANALAAVGPIFIEIDCVWKRPGSMKNESPDKRIWRMALKRDDWDNLAKSVCDAINGVMYMDDSQIVGGTVRKFYGRVGEVAHVRIAIRSLIVKGSQTHGQETV